MLWKVCLIDNNIDPYEDMLIRKIAGLLYVEAKDSNEAKKKSFEIFRKIERKFIYALCSH